MKEIFYGIFVHPLVVILLTIYLFLNDFGITIILMSLLLKIFLSPLSFLQYLEEKKLKKIRERVNKETINIKDFIKKVEIMNKIYEEEKFSPFKNILINFSLIPFYLGAILAIYELVKTIPNVLFLNYINLLKPNIYLAFITTFFNFYYAYNQPGENRKIMFFIFGVLSVILFTLPSFLILYILTSIILSFLERKIFDWYYVKFIIKSV